MFGKKCSCHRARHLTIILSFFCICVLTLVAVYTAGWKREDDLLWEDEFEFFDEEKWQHVITANRGKTDEFQYYRRDKRNSYVHNGSLHLRATLVHEELDDAAMRTGYQNLPGCNVEPCVVRGDPVGDGLLPVYSAQVRTKVFSLRRGRVRVRARFPSGDWLRAEIALLPRENAYGGWPTSGEIVLAEVCGNRYLSGSDGHPLGASTVRQSLRWSPSSPRNASHRNHTRSTRWERVLQEGFFSDDFHVFELDWTDEYLSFRVDDAETGRIVPPSGGFWELGGFAVAVPEMTNPWAGGSAMAPFDRPFHIVLRLSAGGEFFRDVPGPKPWDPDGPHPNTDFYELSSYFTATWDRPELEVDYVKVYRL